MKNSNKKIYIVLAIILSILLLFVGILFANINGDKICKNTYINNVNIGKLTKKQASDKLNKIYNIDKINFKYNDRVFKLSPEKIDFYYDIDKTVNEAYSLNRNGNFLEDLKKTIKSLIGQKNITNLSIKYNSNKFKSYMKDISKDIDISMENAELKIEGYNNIKIKSDVEGIDLDIEKSMNNSITELKKGNSSIDLVVNKIKPNVTEENLKNIDTVLGTYSTKFNSSVAGRSHNIALAAKSTSEVLLMPGESFSYNKHTGNRTISNGYKNAPVIVQGVVQEGVGGGVCQVSSTLYNAVLYAGLEIESIKNHSIPSSYVDKGRDATVSYGSIDFVFKNNLSYPVYVKNSVYGNNVTCTIYGSSKDKQKIEILTNTDSVSEAPIKKVDDPTLPKGEEKKLESGRNGYTVSTYRIYKDSNGNLLKKEKVYVSYYPKKQGVVAVGTMETPVVEEQTPTVEEIPSDEVVTPENEAINLEETIQPPVQEEPVVNS